MFGFRAGSSTTKAAYRFLVEITSSIENGMHVAATFCDLSKAFDCVSHNILCEKLESIAIRGTANSLVHSFLTDRFQCVSLDNTLSVKRTVSHGVPQGSILGPLLFYINEMPNFIQSVITYMLADDSTFLSKDHNYKRIPDLISLSLDQALDWFTSNKLSLNVDKTNFMAFSLNKNFAENLALYAENKVKFLGFYLDSQLNWKTHKQYGK